MPTQSPIVSVIICTAHRQAPLRDCIKSVLSQSLLLDLYEVIVINNVLEDDLIVRSMLHDLDADEKILYEIEKVEGLSPARNHGIALAKADILVFIDDDAIAEPAWLEDLLKTYREHPDAAVVGGKINLFWEGDVPEWLHPELYDCLGELDYGEGVFTIQKNQRLGGGNFSIKKSWLEKCGVFLLQLGRDRKTLLSGEETELLLRVWAQGGECYYVSSSIVLHPAPLYRMNKGFFKQRAYWGSRSTARIDQMHSPQLVIQTLLGMLVRLPYHWIRSIWFKITNESALSFLWEIYCWRTIGYFTETISRMI